MKTLTYKGKITGKVYRDNDDALFIGDLDEPIAEILQDEISGKQVTVRYWLSDEEKTKEEALEGFLKSLYGVLDAEYRDRYSEITGYLWTDESLRIGGHDLMQELCAHKGYYLILEIDVH